MRVPDLLYGLHEPQNTALRRCLKPHTTWIHSPTWTQKHEIPAQKLKVSWYCYLNSKDDSGDILYIIDHEKIKTNN